MKYFVNLEIYWSWVISFWIRDWQDTIDRLKSIGTMVCNDTDGVHS